MAPQSWIGPHPSATDSTPPPPPIPAPRYDLRPLAVGEILDRVLSIYRSNFWLLAGLSAVSAGVSVGVAMLRLIYQYFAGITVASHSYALVTLGFTLIQAALYLIAYSLTLAATTYAVNAIYLGQPTSMGSALHTARRLWLRCLGVAFWQGWSASWAFIFLLLPFLFLTPALRGPAGAVLFGISMFVVFLAGVVYGVIAYLRNSLAVPAAVIEDLGVRAAMRRSKRLATGRVGRIFLLLLLVYALFLAAAVIQIPLAVFLVRSHSTERFVLQGIALAVNFISTTVVGPIAAIGFCLFYFDERVRREGFDIEVLLQSASLASPAAAAPVAESGAAGIPQPTPEQI